MDNKDKEIELILQNMGLVLSQSLYFRPSAYIGVDDYKQAGIVGLLKAIRKLDPTRAKLATFSYHTIKNELLLEHRKNKRNLSLLGEDDIKVQSKESVSFKEFLPDMSDIDKKLIQYKLDGETIADIATKMYMTQNEVKNNLKRIYKNIKDANE